MLICIYVYMFFLIYIVYDVYYVYYVYYYIMYIMYVMYIIYIHICIHIYLYIWLHINIHHYISYMNIYVWYIHFISTMHHSTFWPFHFVFQASPRHRPRMPRSGMDPTSISCPWWAHSNARTLPARRFEGMAGDVWEWLSRWFQLDGLNMLPSGKR